MTAGSVNVVNLEHCFGQVGADRSRSSSAGELHPYDRVTGGSYPPPVPTERGVRFLLRCTFGVPHHALRQVVYSTFAAIRPRSVSMVSFILSLHSAACGRNRRRLPRCGPDLTCGDRISNLTSR